MNSGTVEGVGIGHWCRAVELDEALQAFAAIVEVDGTGSDGQLATELPRGHGWPKGLEGPTPS